MKIMKFLLLSIFTLMVAISLNAQGEPRAYFIGHGKDKGLILDGKAYYQVSPSIFVNNRDTVEKLQHPRGGNPAIQREGYIYLGSIREALAFKKSECTSSQVVDLYRKVKLTPKGAPETKIVTVVKDSIIYDWCTDSIFMDTGSVKYKMPIDTGGLWVTFYPDLELYKNFSSGEKAGHVFKLGTEVFIWNAEKAPMIVKVLNTPDSLKADSVANPKISEPDPLLYNIRVLGINEIGLEPVTEGFFASDDSCFVCAQKKKAYLPVGEVAAAIQYAPRRPLGDKQFQVSVMFEVRYRYFGDVTAIPNSNGWNRLSLGLPVRLDYGPFCGQLRPKWTPGLGMGWTASIAYNLVHWAPKKEARVPKLPHFGLGGS